MNYRASLSALVFASIAVAAAACQITVNDGSADGGAKSDAAPVMTSDAMAASDAPVSMGSDGGTCSQAVDFGQGAACNTCSAGKCCAAIEACLVTSKACQDLNKAYNDCASLPAADQQACNDAADKAFPTGVAVYDAIGTCQAASCAADCK
jgi:hypothetical protein